MIFSYIDIKLNQSTEIECDKHIELKNKILFLKATYYSENFEKSQERL